MLFETLNVAEQIWHLFLAMTEAATSVHTDHDIGESQRLFIIQSASIIGTRTSKEMHLAFGNNMCKPSGENEWQVMSIMLTELPLRCALSEYTQNVASWGEEWQAH